MNEQKSPMEQRFKEGDRVAVYGATQTGWDKIEYGRKTGRIINVGHDYVNVEVGGLTATFHPKQCRRLKKRIKVRWATSDWARKDNGRLSAWAPDELREAVGGPIRITVEVGHD